MLGTDAVSSDGSGGARRSTRARAPRSLLTYAGGEAVEAAVVHTADSSSEGEEDVVDAFDGDSGNGKTRRAKKTRTNRVSADESSGREVYDAVSSGGTALQLVVDAWTRRHEEDAAAAAADVLNAVLRVAGATNTLLDAADVANGDHASVLAALQEAWHRGDAEVGAPLLAGPRRGQGARRAWGDFWRRWAEVALDADAGRVWALVRDGAAVLPWLVVMSSSAFRPLRHAAALASYGAVSGMCALLRRLGRQHDALGARRGASVAGTVAAVEWAVRALFDGVFVQRFRDVDAGVRCASVSALADWVAHAPAVFLENAYVRYLGWALHDRESSVRHAAADALRDVADAGPEQRDGLGALLRRFGPRLAEMAARDVDVGVRAAACGLVAALYRYSTSDGRADVWPQREDLGFCLLLPRGGVLGKEALGLLSLYVFGTAEPSLDLLAEAISRVDSVADAERVVFALRTVLLDLRNAERVISWAVERLGGNGAESGIDRSDNENAPKRVRRTGHKGKAAVKSGDAHPIVTTDRQTAALLILEAVARYGFVFGERVPDALRCCARSVSSVGMPDARSSGLWDALREHVAVLLRAARCGSDLALAAVCELLSLVEPSAVEDDAKAEILSAAVDAVLIVASDECACAVVRLVAGLAPSNSHADFVAAAMARGSIVLQWRVAATLSGAAPSAMPDLGALSGASASEVRALIGLARLVSPAGAVAGAQLPVLAATQSEAAAVAAASLADAPLAEDDRGAVYSLCAAAVAERTAPFVGGASGSGSLAGHAASLSQAACRAYVCGLPDSAAGAPLLFSSLLGACDSRVPSALRARVLSLLAAAVRATAARCGAAADVFLAVVSHLSRSGDEAGPLAAVAPLLAPLLGKADSSKLVSLFESLVGAPAERTSSAALDALLPPSLLPAVARACTPAQIAEMHALWRRVSRPSDSAVFRFLCRVISGHVASSHPASPAQHPSVGGPSSDVLYRELTSVADDTAAPSSPFGASSDGPVRVVRY